MQMGLIRDKQGVETHFGAGQDQLVAYCMSNIMITFSNRSGLCRCHSCQMRQSECKWDSFEISKVLKPTLEQGKVSLWHIVCISHIMITFSNRSGLCRCHSCQMRQSECKWDSFEISKVLKPTFGQGKVSLWHIVCISHIMITFSKFLGAVSADAIHAR